MRPRVLLVLGLVVFGAGCSQPLSTREKGALAGGAIGAGSGAIIGSQVGHPGGGALIGAGVGAVSGAIIGDAIQNNEQKKTQQAPPPVATAPSPPQQVVVVTPPPVAPARPRLIWVPKWKMYVMEGHDVVYYNKAYYYYHGGHWWLGQAHTGPWAVVMAPPPAIRQLPAGRLHAHIPPGAKHCPPGHAKQGRC